MVRPKHNVRRMEDKWFINVDHWQSYASLSVAVVVINN